jgi:hypothetical protein
LLGHEPEVFFLVTRPEKIEPDMVLSPTLQKAVGPAIQMIIKICYNWSTRSARSVELCIL